ncbi:hypothetical protein EN821_36410, partial [Mesorhizobium sp. M2D.F.Ca.ET.178.01.1.1]
LLRVQLVDQPLHVLGRRHRPRTMPPAPAAAKLIAEHNLSVDQLSGSGKRGQVLKGDVLDAIAKGAPSQPAETPKAAPAPVAARAGRPSKHQPVAEKP